nr:MAG TPA: hypothetical protein [Caudoviricetes sp.]
MIMTNFFKHLKRILSLKEGETYEVDVEISFEQVFLFLIFVILLLWILVR